MSSFDQPEKGSPEETANARETAVLLARELGLSEEKDPGIFGIIKNSLVWKDDQNNYVIQTPGGEKAGFEDWLMKAKETREKEREEIESAGKRREENIQKAKENSGGKGILGEL